MEIRIVDRWRNVRQAPAKGPPFAETTTGEGKDKRVTTYADVLDALMAGHAVQTGQVEFEVDQEFLAALDAEKPEGLTEEAPLKTAHGERSRIWRSLVPIVVTGSEPESPQAA